MFAAMTLACLALGTWSVYVNPYREQAAAVAWVRKLGGLVDERSATGPDWQRFLVQTMLGEGSFSEAFHVDLRNTKIPDELQDQLGRLLFVEELNLDGSAIDDRAILSLGSARNLKRLSLRYTGVTNRGLEAAGHFPLLERLRVTGAKVGDSGLLSLSKSGSLRELYIRWTDVTASGLERFREAKPDCKVHFHLNPTRTS